jgi:hypothetical protein
VQYIQLWKMSWTNGGESIVNCGLHSLLRRNGSRKGYLMDVQWVPTSLPHSSSSSSSSSSASSSPSSSTPSPASRTGILCTLSSYGALNIVVVPTLMPKDLSSAASPSNTAPIVLEHTSNALSLSQHSVRCISFSNVYGNVLLVGTTTGVVELWRLNAEATSSSAFATKLRSFDHMYDCRHHLDATRHSISAMDWSPHDRHRFVSGKHFVVVVFNVCTLLQYMSDSSAQWLFFFFPPKPMNEAILLYGISETPLDP